MASPAYNAKQDDTPSQIIIRRLFENDDSLLSRLSTVPPVSPGIFGPRASGRFPSFPLCLPLFPHHRLGLFFACGRCATLQLAERASTTGAF